METKETVRTADPATRLVHEAGLSGRGLRATMVALAVMAAGLFWVAPVAAQATGTITGTVADAETGAPVSGAQISVPALGVGVLSSGSGRFVLPGVPVGTHELRADRLVCGRPQLGKRGFGTELVAVGQVLSYVRPLDAALFGCGPVWCSWIGSKSA